MNKHNQVQILDKTAAKLTEDLRIVKSVNGSEAISGEKKTEIAHVVTTPSYTGSVKNNVPIPHLEVHNVTVADMYSLMNITTVQVGTIVIRPCCLEAGSAAVAIAALGNLRIK